MPTEYTERLRAEIEHFRFVENVHDLPEIFHVWSIKYVRPKIEAVLGISILGMEEFYARYIAQYAAENPSEPVRIASIGAGNGDLEVKVATLLKNTGLLRFRFQCLDVNPAMLERGREAASKEQLTEHFEFLESDVSQWSPEQPLGIVMAHHSLHHIQQLESTFANIHKAIGHKGYFLTCDMIGRNGHMRWPEALEIVHDIWRTAPDRYKYNHQSKRFEELYENWDCSTEGFEGIRAQDILPLLVKMFKFEAFVAYGNLPDVFVDRGFGHNLSPENPEDVAFINRVGELNDRLISEGKIKPTQMLAVMRASGARPCKYYLHWTPEFCVRSPLEPPSANESGKVEAAAANPGTDARDGAGADVFMVPLSGCGKQQGPARGFWPDGWIASPFDVMIRLEHDLDSIVIDAYLPEHLQHEPELCVRLNGAAALRQRARPGLFSLRLRSQILGGELLQLRITSDRSCCPALEGTSADRRELAIVLREIRIIPRSASDDHARLPVFQRLLRKWLWNRAAAS